MRNFKNILFYLFYVSKLLTDTVFFLILPSGSTRFQKKILQRKSCLCVSSG